MEYLLPYRLSVLHCLSLRPLLFESPASLVLVTLALLMEGLQSVLQLTLQSVPQSVLHFTCQSAPQVVPHLTLEVVLLLS